MIKNQRILVTFIYIFLLLTKTCFASSDQNIMPVDLVGFAKELGCEQVKDFYANRPGELNPPFIYNSTPNSFGKVFWCQKEDHKNIFILQVIYSGKTDYPQCKREIPQKNFPGGLAVFPQNGLPMFSPNDWTLDMFFYLEDQNKKGPNVPLEHEGIIEHYDGHGTIFYCHNGKWLVYPFH